MKNAGPVRTAERELLERTPSDEQTAGRGLDESEVGHRSGFYAVRLPVP